MAYFLHSAHAEDHQMKRVISTTGIALTLAVGLAAQTPQTPPAGTRGERPKGGADQSVTLKGCLRAGEGANTFVLANVDMTGLQEPDPAVGTTGMEMQPTKPEPSQPEAVASADTAAQAKATVRLMSSGSVDLAAHVGHTIEVTGTLAPRAETDNAAPAAAETAETRPTTGDMTQKTQPHAGMKHDEGGLQAHRLTVKSIKHVDAKCTP
ncbi:MAG: hypothetical protein LC804_13780 [Acidobacteria bacterium]|nr:hypothetical protein [Acidobacteriota bacterium]